PRPLPIRISSRTPSTCRRAGWVSPACRLSRRPSATPSLRRPENASASCRSATSWPDQGAATTVLEPGIFPGLLLLCCLLLTQGWQQLGGMSFAAGAIRNGADRDHQGKLPLRQHAIRSERRAKGRDTLHLLVLLQERL